MTCELAEKNADNKPNIAGKIFELNPGFTTNNAPRKTRTNNVNCWNLILSFKKITDKKIIKKGA